MAESSESIFVQEDGISTLHGSMKVDGNLEVGTQISTKELKVVDGNHVSIIQTAGDEIQFRKPVNFQEAVQFSNGRTMIGNETTYNSAYVGTETLQAGQRIVVGDSLFKITADQRKIIADTFRMTLARLDVDNLVSKKEYSNSIEAKSIKATQEIIGKNIFADTIKTNKLFLDSIGSRSLQTTENMTTRDLIVGGSAKIENDLTIVGTGVGPNGAALTVNGGEIIANNGIVSHTGNNRFQTMQITGGGPKYKDACFKIDRGVESLIEGDVTIEGSKLILDNSKLVTDNIVVTPIGEIREDEPLSGVQITTKDTWDTYRDGMVQVVEPSKTQMSEDCEYDPMDAIEQASERTEDNYRQAGLDIRQIVNPVTYLNESRDSQIPKKFNVKNGLYRVDSSGNALMRNLVAETATFSQLDAYRFNVNRLSVDKLITTAVASNVVHTDQLLKSKTLAEFDGSVNVGADVFMEDGSTMNVSSGSKVTFQSGSELVLKSGARLDLGQDTSMKMLGDVELDLNKVVFVDSSTGKKYRIKFEDLGETDGVVMKYQRVADSEQESTGETSRKTELDARELDSKLKSLGL